MSINYAILGILSFKSSTGYDLKKIIQDSPFMHWSGNNNQIYKALVELLEDGLVTNEVQHQESSPSKKIYTITEDGLKELRKWVLSSPEGPEFKKMFLVQLAWSSQLEVYEIEGMLSAYENEIKLEILMEKEKRKRQIFMPDRTPRESQIWELIYDNIISTYENELKWIEKVRSNICSDDKEIKLMKYKIIEKGSKKYILCDSSQWPLVSEQDTLDIIGICGENDTNLLMLDSNSISGDFFNLSTGFAGQVLQKLANYHVKAALVLARDQKVTSKFKELQRETNKGNSFRIFDNKEMAENWLLL